MQTPTAAEFRRKAAAARRRSRRLLRLSYVFAFIAFWIAILFDLVYTGVPSVLAVSLFIFSLGQKSIAQIREEAAEGIDELDRLLR